MAQEIERKFLVRGGFMQEVVRSTHIVQGYLSLNPERTVRIRLRGERGYLTTKGRSFDGGVSRFEHEREISIEEARELMRHCLPGLIDKIRHEVVWGRHLFEVDQFLGENEGLVLAEVELSAVDEAFDRPEWLGEEVTGIERYYNAMLMRFPYNSWK